MEDELNKCHINIIKFFSVIWSTIVTVLLCSSEMAELDIQVEWI